MRHSSSPRGQTRLLYMDKHSLMTGLSCVANRPSLAPQLGEIPAGFHSHDSHCQNSRTRLYLMRIQQWGRARQDRLRRQRRPTNSCTAKPLLFSFLAAFNHQREPQAPDGASLWVPHKHKNLPSNTAETKLFNIIFPSFFSPSCPVLKSELRRSQTEVVMVALL